MQKLALLVSAKEQERALAQLQDLGVVHIDGVGDSSSENIHAIRAGLAEVDKALAIIGFVGGEGTAGVEDRAKTESEEWESVAARLKEILAVARRKEELSHQLEKWRQTLGWFGDWGAVSPAALERLEKAGIVIRFYIIDTNERQRLPADALIRVVKEEAGRCYIAHIGAGSAAGLAGTRIEVPSSELAEVETEITQTKAALAELEQALAGYLAQGPDLLAYRDELRRRLAFAQVKNGMVEDGRIAYLEGFCPVEQVDRIEAMAKGQGWGYVLEEADPDEVPTLVRTPRWVRIISPVFAFMGTLPGYREYDISFWFLLFFSVFFALLIGDAGYGLVFLGLSVFFGQKFKHRSREPFVLMYVLSGATVLWGAITGTWFGFEQFARLPLLSLLVVERLDSYVAANQDFIIYLCFSIGAVHLTVAHLLAFFRYINSPMALAQLGWIAIVWPLFFLAGNLVLGRSVPDFALAVLGSGALLVLFCTRPQKGLLKGALQTLADLPLKVIGSFSDIVSYLRLFAVGYASVTVAASFNEMGLGIGFNSLVNGFLASFVLFLGHGVNIMLGLMAVVVHGIRLNMLEFSGHLDMQWSGKAYKPFKAAAKD